MSEADKPLMPKATAVWLVENTALTFEQIAELCQLHMLEVKGIADGDVAQGIRGKDPITGGELNRDEIKKGEADPSYRLKLMKSKVVLPPSKAKKPSRYTPTSRRQDRPNAILWLVRNHPELKDSQIIKLVGTTKPTITQIRDRSHWNSANLVPQDPVTLGLCAQTELDGEVQKAAARVTKELADAGPPLEPGGTLAPTSATTGYDPSALDAEQPQFEPAQQDLSNNEAEEEARMLEQLRQLPSTSAVADEEQPDVTDVFAENAPQPDMPVVPEPVAPEEEGAEGHVAEEEPSEDDEQPKTE